MAPEQDHTRDRPWLSAWPAGWSPRGSVVIPIQMAAGSRYPEHLHVSVEHVVFLPGSGPIVDRQGRYLRTGEYRMPPGSIHTPTVPLGVPPALFLGVAGKGVVVTPFGIGTRGAELQELVGAPTEDWARLFEELPPDSPKKGGETPRADLARALFGDLDFLTRRRALQRLTGRPIGRPEHDAGIQVESVPLPSLRELFQFVLGLGPNERLVWARETNILIPAP